MLVMELPIHIDCEVVDDALDNEIVLLGLTTICPEAVFVPVEQPPVNVTI